MNGWHYVACCAALTPQTRASYPTRATAGYSGNFERELFDFVSSESDPGLTITMSVTESRKLLTSFAALVSLIQQLLI